MTKPPPSSLVGSRRCIFCGTPRCRRGRRSSCTVRPGASGSSRCNWRSILARMSPACAAPTIDMVKSLGADAVVDYTKQDFSSAGRVYDIILDTVGKSGFSRSMKALKRGGYYVLIGGSGRLADIFSDLVRGLWASITA